MSALAPADLPSAFGIEAVGAARSFGSVHAVRSATFTAPYGAVTGLIGPNGSGKTTLMLMLASLLKPDAGAVRIAGHDPVTEPGAVRAAMGWMPDLLGSWANLSVRTTLELTGRLHGLTRPEARTRADELIGIVRLEAFSTQPTRVLSRGQKQRLSLARAIVHDPRVLLLDEPASGLDPEARVELRGIVRRFADEGRCILVSSHVLAELEEMADSAVYLDAGTTVSEERIARARMSLRSWRIRGLDDAALVAALPQLGVDASRVHADHQGTLVGFASDEAAAAFLTHAVGAGFAITAFAPAVGELEQTFLELSRDGERTAAQQLADRAEDPKEDPNKDPTPKPPQDDGGLR